MAQNSSGNEDLLQLLTGFQEETWNRCGVASHRARSWSRWSVCFALVATLGSGAAGATVAAGTLSPTTRAVVAILAFAAAGLSGFRRPWERQGEPDVRSSNQTSSLR